MINIQYNTQKDRLAIPEYGRNVQQLIEYAKTIEDKEDRQKFAEVVVNLMHQILPGNKNFDDKKTRLWNHLFQIANHELDVDAPEGLELLAPNEIIKPRRIPYPSKKRNNRHYGSKIQLMIDRAISLEDEEKKKAFCIIIASYMKTAYRSWNGNHVNDEIIKRELSKMSDGQLILDDDVVLDNPGQGGNHRRRRNFSGGSGRPNHHRRNNNRNHGSNNNRRRKR